MRFPLTFFLILSAFCAHQTNTFAAPSSQSLPSITDVSHKSLSSSSTPCSPIIEAQFINYQFSCIDGCIILGNYQSITLTSLILSDISNTLTTCIEFVDILKVEIHTLTLSNLVIEMNNSQRYFIYFKNIDSLTISQLTISNIAQVNPSNDQSAIYFDQSVNSQILQTVKISSKSNFDSPFRTYPFYYLLYSYARTIIVSTLYVIDCYDQISFSTISTIEFDRIVFQQALTSLSQNSLIRPTLELRAQTSIVVNSIEILDKRDPYEQLTIDFMFTPIIKNSQYQTQITIGSITRNTQSITSQVIQSAQSSFRTVFQPVRSSGQTFNPNLEIHSISASMSLSSGSQFKQAQLLFNIWQFNIVKIDSILLTDYTKQLINFNLISSISIGELQVIGSRYSTSQQDSLIIEQCLISAQSSSSLSFQKIILQNVVMNQITYLSIGLVDMLTIQSLLIQNSVFISSQFLNVVESTSVIVSNTQILDSVLRISVQKEQSLPIFSIMNSENLEITDFAMSSPNLNINWIESLQSNSLSWSQSVILSNNCSSLTFTDIHADFSGLKLGFFSSLNFQNKINLSNSTFDRCYASLGGGCFQFNLNGNKYSMHEPQFYLYNVTFIRASSGYFGGAIFGSEIISAIDVHFESCSSLIGGALFLKGQSDLDAVANITFVNNVADIVNPNICFGVNNIRKGQVKEYNPTLQGTPLYLNPIGQYSNQIQFYPGILYIYELEFLIDGQWYSQIPKTRTALKQSNKELISQGNVFPFATQEYLLYNSQIMNETNFFILYDPTNSYQNEGTFTEIKFTFSRFSDFYIMLDQASSAQCKEGMETIMFQNGYNHICEYCGLSKAIVSTNTVCQTCDVNYFQTCYSNQTELNKGYWRSTYTINTTLIETCSISMSSCNGGFGIGNSLCYEGHIGPQCLNCDIRGEYWGQSYSMQGVYTCNKCSDIKQNEIKIILGLVLISLSLLVMIKGNFKATKNQIFADYLGKIKMIYIGNSLSRLQQMSTCLKVLLFNLFFANLINSFTKVRILESLSETSVILNQPLATQFFSFDCFLANQFSKDVNLGFANLVVSIATPGIIFTAHILFEVVLLLVKKFQQKKLEIKSILSSFILSFTYLYLIVFYPFIFQLCLKSFYCIRLEGSRTFSQIDLSLECGDSSNNNLQNIHSLAAPVLCLIIIFTPLAILLFLYHRRAKLRTVNMMLSLGFLYREYKNQFFLWEFVRIILKSVCVFSQIAFIRNPQLYGTIIALLLTIYLVMLIFKQPFQGKLFNQLEQISVSIQILSIMSAILFSEQELNQIQNESMIDILFIGSQILNGIFIVYLSMLIIFSFSQKQLIKLHRKWKIPFAERFLPLYSNQLRNNFKRLRNLIFKIKGRVHSVRIDEIQSLLNSDYQHIPFEEEKDNDEINHFEYQESVKQLEFDTEQIDPEKLLKNN